VKTHSATFFVQLEAEWGHWANADGERPVWGAKAVNITQKRPSRPKPGTVVVKLTVEVPEAAFLPLRPEAVITIPAELTQPHPLEVTAEDPSA
jgi:hypothetical protein